MSTTSLRLFAIWQALVDNTELSEFVSNEDIVYMERRVRAEGLTFLTVTLPALGKLMYQSFETGQLLDCEDFKRVKGRPYPYFLRKAWETLFDEQGRLRWYESSPNNLWRFVCDQDKGASANAARVISQLTMIYYKLKLPYSTDQLSSTFSKFIETEKELSNHTIDWNAKLPVLIGGSACSVTYVLTRARYLVRRLLHRSDPMEVAPRHGSGASACKTKPWERYANPRFIPKLDAVYPYTEYFVTSINHLAEMGGLDSMVHTENPMARVAVVPKDSRGPRLISTEPREYMFIQQGLMAKLYETIDSYPLVSGQLSCVDQFRNRQLAHDASVWGTHATLDLKDASDRVTLELVEYLFPENWVRCLKACRSESTVLPDGTIVPFKKFAPMGSAVCFPVEAIVFWAITVAAARGSDPGYLDNLFSNRAPLTSASDKFAVFGDDIICPVEHVKNVVFSLEAVGLRVNTSKCYTQGPFRESCGGDYFEGVDITPIRINHLPLDEGETDDINYTKFRVLDGFNNLILKYSPFLVGDPLRDLYESWYGSVCTSCRYFHKPVEGYEVDRTVIPYDGLVLIGRWTSIPRGFKKRWNPFLSRNEVRVPLESAKTIELPNDDWCHLLRGLLRVAGDSGVGVVSLAKRYKYKYGWVEF